MREKKLSGEKPILLTTSFNCIEYEASDYFKQREAWASSHGFAHLYVTEATTGLTMDAHASAWLRIPLLNALRGRSVFYLDHDCLIAEDTPHPRFVTGGLDGLFIARGHSGRPNSGVLIVPPNGSEIFDFCIEHVAEAVPLPCSAPYENGHVIWACMVHPWRPLPQWMNNTTGPTGKIVHHTGPNQHLRDLRYVSDADRRVDFSLATLVSSSSLSAMADAALRRLSI